MPGTFWSRKIGTATKRKGLPARLAVYEEIMTREKNHQNPATRRVDILLGFKSEPCCMSVPMGYQNAFANPKCLPSSLENLETTYIVSDTNVYENKMEIQISNAKGVKNENNLAEGRFGTLNRMLMPRCMKGFVKSITYMDITYLISIHFV